MRKLTMMAAIGVLVLVPMTAMALNINEVRIDNVGGDTDEYFELAGMPGELLDGLFYIVIGDGAGGSGVLESITDLSGLAIAADGYLSVHNGATIGTCTTYDVEATMAFENSDNVTHMLVQGMTGVLQDDLDIDDDGVLDVIPWTGIIDSVSIIESVGTGDLYYGANEVGPDGTFVPGHALVCNGNWIVGAFDLCLYDSPGADNAGSCAVGNEDLSFGTMKGMFR